MISRKITFLPSSSDCLRAAAFFLLAWITPAAAADFSVREVITDKGVQHWIYIKGGIEEGDSMKFINTFISYDDITTAWLESEGGMVDEGMAIAKIIRMLEIDTYTETMCNSICSIMFLSGNKKMVTETAEIGVHAAYDQLNGLKVIDANALIGWYLGSINYPEELVNLWVETPPKKILDLNKGTAKRLGLGFTTIPAVKRPLIDRLLSSD